jgi:hypothetical protein
MPERAVDGNAQNFATDAPREPRLVLPVILRYRPLWTSPWALSGSLRSWPRFVRCSPPSHDSLEICVAWQGSLPQVRLSGRTKGAGKVLHAWSRIKVRSHRRGVREVWKPLVVMQAAELAVALKALG